MKTEREKRAKAKRDAEREPVKIAEKMVNVINCEKRLSAIAVKEEGKKGIEERCSGRMQSCISMRMDLSYCLT